MFVVVVAILLVLIVGAVTFTDVVNNDMNDLKAAVLRFLRGPGANSPR